MTDIPRLMDLEDHMDFGDEARRRKVVTYTLVNDFHNTFTRVRTADRMLNRRQVLRAQRNLCGVYDCECGGYAGERGGRYFVDLYHRGPDLHGDAFILMDREEYERMMREAGENWQGPVDLDDYFERREVIV